MAIMLSMCHGREVKEMNENEIAITHKKSLEIARAMGLKIVDNSRAHIWMLELENILTGNKPYTSWWNDNLVWMHSCPQSLWLDKIHELVVGNELEEG